MNNFSIRKFYLYAFAVIGLILITMAGVRVIGLGLKMYVFTEADNYYIYPYAKPITPTDGIKTEEPSREEVDKYNMSQRNSNRQREAAESLAMLLVGLPLYLYHWREIQKDKEINNA